MAHDRRSALDSLRAELAFVESGAYRNPSRAKWRPQFVFQDSPTCLNQNPFEKRRPCSECVLTKFFPSDSRAERIPCRHIPLNQAGETIDSLYRTGTPEELESALVGWLKATIQRLECEEAEELKRQEHPVIHVEARFADDQPPDEKICMFSVCANPQCRAPFACGEGRFFRFRKTQSAGREVTNSHSVQHFWLCVNCCQRLTLEFRDGIGVSVKNRSDVPSEAELSRCGATSRV